MRMDLRAFIALVLFVAQCCLCLIVEYDGVEVGSGLVICNSPVLMMTEADAPRGSNPPTLDVDLRFNPNINATSADDVVKLEIYQSNGEKPKNQNRCPQVPASVWFSKVTTLAALQAEGFKHAVDVPATGYYILSISNGYPAAISYTGSATWINPFGHLPGDIYGFLPFYQGMSIFLLITGLVWAALNVIYRKELLRLQHYLTATLIICLIEFTSWYSYYSAFNETGLPSTPGLALALLVTVSRRTVSRMLVVAVSMGLGVVKASLGRADNIKIAVAGTVYFIAELIDEMVLHYGHLNEVDTFTRMMLIMPTTFLDAIFYWWIFTSLSATLDSLQSANQFSKLTVYKNFSRVLGLSLFAATLMAIYTMYWVSYGEQHPWMWLQRWFIENGFWQSLYVAVLVCALVLWRPSAHQKDVVGAFELPQDEEEDELTLNADLEDYTDDQLDPEISGADMFSIDGDEDPESAGQVSTDKTISSM